MEIIIAGKWKLGKRVGGGSFGEVYEGKEIETGLTVGLKLEPLKSPGGPQLIYEYHIYKILKGKPGIPNVAWFGKEGLYNVMVMDLLGRNLEDLLTLCGGKFTLKTVCQLAVQLITRLEDVHSKGLIHRDIKPENFLIGRKNTEIVHLIDFGLAKKYIDSKTKQHMEYTSNKELTGTVRYASLNAHLGIAQSRRDDLESLGFLFVYFLKGRLPWQGLRAEEKKKKYEKVLRMKIDTSIDALCKGTPDEFKRYLTYCRELRFDAKPDYTYLRRLFTDLHQKSQFPNDNIFDWHIYQKPDQKDAKAGPPAAPTSAAAAPPTTAPSAATATATSKPSTPAPAPTSVHLTQSSINSLSALPNSYHTTASQLTNTTTHSLYSSPPTPLGSSFGNSLPQTPQHTSPNATPRLAPPTPPTNQQQQQQSSHPPPHPHNPAASSSDASLVASLSKLHIQPPTGK